jgi:beta-galactosidase
LKSLNQTVKELDPSRLVVAASWTSDAIPLNQIVDWQCINTYPGWYWGKISEFASAIEKSSAHFSGGKRVAVSEYGAGANTEQHEEGEVQKPKPEGKWHPEEYQALTHETEWAIAKNNPHLWGTFVWAMFDFASSKRDEGSQPGINDKGLVTHDRKIRKDAFHFYQANWTDKPMVYIAARRMTPRKQATTEIKAYSNCAKVELRVNGESRGSATPDDVHIARWKEVALKPGRNVIEVMADSAGTKIRDTCEWVLNSP